MANPSNRNLQFSATVACLTGALFGYSVGFIGGILVLPPFLHHFHLNKLNPSALASARSSTVTAWLLGALVGVPLGVPSCNYYGRKSCLALCAVLYVVGATIQLVDIGGQLALFNIGRVLNGIGVGFGTLVSPLYIAEISTPSQRGMLLSGYQTALQFAALAGFWSAFAAHSGFPDSSSLQWKIPVATQLLPGVLLLLGIAAIAESPKFLAQKGKFESAEKSIAWLRGLPQNHPDVASEVDDLLDTTEDVPEQGHKFFHALQKKSIRRRLVVGMGLMIAQNMVGLNALNYYAPTIFMSAGFTNVSASLFLTGIFGITKLLSATFFMFVFVRLRGNRFWLLLGSALCGVSMIVLAICVRTTAAPTSSHPNLNVIGPVSILMVYVFAFAFGISLGPLSWNICSEIFPANITTVCCAITTSVQWLFQIVIAAVTPRLLAHVGWATYIFYAAFCAISFIWVYYSVPETKGVKLGREMDILFTENILSTEDSTVEIGEETPLLGSIDEQNKRRMSFGFPV